MKQIAFFFIISASIIACGSQSNSSTNSPNQEVKQTARVKQLAQHDLKQVLAQDSVIVVDVRTPGEVQAGYIPEADLFIDYRSASFQSKIKELDPNYTYVMYCRSGGRSGQASSFMVQNGFNNVYNLQGGVLQYTGELKKP
jgi:rhodanese-related sulfurtransferase